MKNFKDLLELVAAGLLEKEKLIDSELAKLPKGNLTILKRGKNYYFSNQIKGSNRGITKDKDLLHMLARRRYLETIKREMGADVAFAKSVKKPKPKVEPEHRRSYKGTSELLRAFEDAGLDIMRITCTKQQYQWFKRKYKKSTMHPEELRYSTNSGVKVRSKSEQTIGNLLERFGIPYHYEEALDVDVSWMEGVEGHTWNGTKTYYPDFTIMLPDGTIIIWEHLGCVDLAGYRKHNAEKIAAMRGSGLLAFDQLITTYESDMQCAGEIELIIRQRILTKELN